MTPTRRSSFLSSALLCFAAAACGGDDPAPVGSDTELDATDGSSGDVADDAADAGADVAPDVVPDATDAGGDGSGADADASPDVAPDVPTLECDPPKRPVGERCREENDRVCLVDADCRELEVCVLGDGEEIGTCTYTPIAAYACPGGPACESAGDAPLLVGFGARVVTPTGWEFGRPRNTREPDAWGNPRKFAGDVTDPGTFCDCGLDMICPPTEEYADCVSLGEYTGPDADGTEGDGYMQGAWIAGFGSDRNAQLCLEEWVGEDCEAGNQCCVSRLAHDHMWARAVVFDQGDTRVALVSIDAVGFFYSDVQKILAELPEELGVDRIVSSATHTHEAPDTMGRWGPSVYANGLPTDSGVVPQHMRVIYDGVIGAIEDAVGELAETDIYVAKENTGAVGFAVDDSRHPFVFNDLAMIVHFVRKGGDRANPDDTLGTLFNWHNHPETLSDDNMYISSDFPHYVREYLENGLPEIRDGDTVVAPAVPGLGGIAVYVSGSVGGLLNPLHTPAIGRDGAVNDDATYDKTEALGERLAELGLRILGTPCEGEERFGCYTQVEDQTLGFAFQEYMLPLENTQFQAAGITLGLFFREIYNYRYQDERTGGLPQVLTATAQIRIGEIAFQAFPGEMFTELILGGYSPDNVRENAIVGDPRDVNCDATGRVLLDAGVEPRFPCILNFRYDPELHPDLDAAPTDGYVRDLVPTDYLFVVGLGLDSLGYIVPTYDFKVGFFYLEEAPGDHYEETVSVGNLYHVTFEAVSAVNALLGAAE